ncbi:hypothetical protein RGC51_01455, partial [Helicobacter pylori]|nr:hypothetical protein [Helicobacter pylori]
LVSPYLKARGFKALVLGKGVKRGLFKSSIGKSLNADINGAIGILRKVFPDAVKTLRDSGVVFTPVKISLAF